MLASLERQTGILVVMRVRGRHVDDIDIGISYQLFV